jgi:hypothetical protein
MTACSAHFGGTRGRRRDAAVNRNLAFSLKRSDKKR